MYRQFSRHSLPAHQFHVRSRQSLRAGRRLGDTQSPRNGLPTVLRGNGAAGASHTQPLRDIPQRGRTHQLGSRRRKSEKAVSDCLMGRVMDSDMLRAIPSTFRPKTFLQFPTKKFCSFSNVFFVQRPEGTTIAGRPVNGLFAKLRSLSRDSDKTAGEWCT